VKDADPDTVQLGGMAADDEEATAAGLAASPSYILPLSRT
jgi:hypothetical protein